MLLLFFFVESTTQIAEQDSEISYYIDPLNGDNNNNNCSQDVPCKTISFLFNSLLNNDTFLSENFEIYSEVKIINIYILQNINDKSNCDNNLIFSDNIFLKLQTINFIGINYNEIVCPGKFLTVSTKIPEVTLNNFYFRDYVRSMIDALDYFKLQLTFNNCKFYNVFFYRSPNIIDVVYIIDSELIDTIFYSKSIVVSNTIVIRKNYYNFVIPFPFVSDFIIENSIEVNNGSFTIYTKKSTKLTDDRNTVHAFIYGRSYSSIAVFNSNFNRQSSNGIIIEKDVGLIKCTDCSLVKISDSIFDNVGDLQFWNNFLVDLYGMVDLNNVQFIKSKYSQLSIQGFNSAILNNITFIENESNSPLIGILQSKNVIINNSYFYRNLASSIFIQNTNMTISNSKFIENEAKDSIVKFLLDELNFSKKLYLTDSSFIQNVGVFGSSLFSNTVNVFLQNCNFLNNYSLKNGGAIYIGDQSQNEKVIAHFINCKFINNYCKDKICQGGSVYFLAESGTITIEQSEFTNTSSYDSGGALYLSVLKTNIYYCKFSNCKSDYDGGGLFIDRGNIEVKYSTFEDSYCGGYGGGIYIKAGTYLYSYHSNFIRGFAKQGRASAIFGERGSSLFIDGSNFINNTAPIRGAAIYLSRGDKLYLHNSIFEGNQIIYLPAVAYTETGPAGAAVFIYTCNIVRITNNTFVRNNIEVIPNQKGMGSALFLAPSRMSTLLKHNTFIRNSCDYGCGLYITSTEFIVNENNPLDLKLFNLTFIENYARNQGGGIYIVNQYYNDTISKQILDCNFIGNTAEDYGDDYASGANYFKILQYIPLPPEIPFPLNIFYKNQPLLYSGQKLYIALSLYDVFNQRMINMKSIDTDMIITKENDPVDKSKHLFYSSTIMNDTISFIRRPIYSKLNESLAIHFISKSVISPLIIKLKISDTCPFSYDFIEKSSIEMECLYNSNYQDIFFIIVGTSSGFILTILILLFIGCCYCFVKKVKEFRKREKLEREFNEKFIEYEILKHHNNNEMTNDKKKKSWIIPIEELKITDRIGSGGESVIFLATWLGNKVAVKRLLDEDYDEITNNSLDDYSIINTSDENKFEDTFEKEAYILSTLRFPNIITFYGICITNTDRFIIVEYLSGGNLREVISESKKGKKLLSLNRKLKYLLDISYGMKYLHNLKPTIIHRDLKPENILLNAETDTCKIADFGLGRSLNNNAQSMLTSNIGTPKYISPEILLDEPYTEKCDVYSYGIIMWELLFELKAFSRESIEIMKTFIQRNSHQSIIEDVTTPLISSSNLTSSVNLLKEDSPLFRIPSSNSVTLSNDIVQGLRPLIPFEFKTTNEIDFLLRQWIIEYLIERERLGMGGIFNNNIQTNSSKGEIQINKLANAIKQFCILMERCWDKDPTVRPSFDEICEVLSRCVSIVNGN
ncbi:hypothetical protein ABK040_011164 [Willaertia magna]